MRDIVFVAVVVAFFIVAALLVTACERIMAAGTDVESRDR